MNLSISELLSVLVQSGAWKIWVFGFLIICIVIFSRALIDRAIAAYFKKNPPKRMATSTLIGIELVVLATLIILWKFL